MQTILNSVQLSNLTNPVFFHKEKVLIYTGRFQPCHIKCIKEAYEKTGFRTVIVATTVSINRELNFKYPFTREQTLEIIQSSIIGLEQFVAHFYIEENVPSIYNVVNSIRTAGYEPTGWIFGDDRIDIRKQVENTTYHQKLNLFDFKPIQISRNIFETSASEIRTCIMNNKPFEHLMNCPNEQSNKVKEWLLTYLFHRTN
jgi:nicotinamide mononucleotide adenylyltransferase